MPCQRMGGNPASVEERDEGVGCFGLHNRAGSRSRGRVGGGWWWGPGSQIPLVCREVGFGSGRRVRLPREVGYVIIPCELVKGTIGLTPVEALTFPCSVRAPHLPGFYFLGGDWGASVFT